MSRVDGRRADELRKIKITKDLRSAVILATNEAKLVASGYPLVVVIFSPGAASFDMFKDYADRGEKFKAIVICLK